MAEGDGETTRVPIANDGGSGSAVVGRVPVHGQMGVDADTTYVGSDTQSRGCRKSV